MRRFILILSALVFSSCDISQGETISLTILSDRTDPSIETPAMIQIQPLLGLDTNPNYGVRLTFQVLGNVDFAPSESLYIDPHSLLDNDFERTSRVEGFLKQVDTLFHRESQKTYSFDNSSILRPLVEQLTKSKASNATHSVVLLFSDLEEISDAFDVMHSGTRKQLLEHPIELAEALKFQMDIPDLEGVYLHIINYPKTREKNRIFRALLELYMALFKDSGLEIHLGLDSLINH